MTTDARLLLLCGVLVVNALVVWRLEHRKPPVPEHAPPLLRLVAR